MLRKFFLSIVASAALSSMAAAPELPIVMILGRPYYCYESSKGESLFGISNRYGWDMELISQLNPNVGSPLQKGTLIYYPAEETVEQSDDNTGEKRQAVVHTVKPGETVYSIARAYGLSVDDFYRMNPSARTGLKSDSKVVIAEESAHPAVTANDDDDKIAGEADFSNGEYTFHTVAEGETLYSIANQYNTNIEDIYKSNLGLTDRDLKTGETVRILPNTRDANVKYETVAEEKLVSVKTYKVQKGDTWGSVARKLGVDAELLREANPGKWKLIKDQVITVPVTQEVEVEHAYIEEDPRELTQEGRRELYEEVHNIATERNVAQHPEVKVAIVLDDVSANRDMEFSRGALLAVDRLKNSPYKITLNIIDGGSPMSKVLTELESMQPDLIVTTADKQLPEYLTDFAKRASVELVNSFDTKSELYLDNPSIIQFLTPTSYFNDSVADFITDRFSEYTLLLTNDNPSGDALFEKMIADFPVGQIETVDVENLTETHLSDFGKYLIYVSQTRKEDVSAILDKVATLKDSNPLAEVVVVGRPSWITFGESLGEKLRAANVLVPSRFYFNSSTPDSRHFIDDYQAMFGQTPIKSYPVYAVAGYDIIRYFFPNLAAAGGDFNAKFSSQPTLQNDIELQRVSNWGGLINKNCCIIKYTEVGNAEKIDL